MAYRTRQASLVVCLVRMFDEVNRAFPGRDHASDGWIGDASHAARPSGHNPDWPRPPGWVHAADVDATKGPGMGSGSVGDHVVAAALRLARSGRWHPIAFIIYKGIIYSRTYGFRARRYNGSNGHFSHAHVEVLKTLRARMWLGAWGIHRQPKAVPRIYAANAVRAFTTRPGSYRYTVMRIQARLVAWGWLDAGYRKGHVDTATKTAYRGWQAKRGYPPTGVPTRAQLVRLAGARYRVAA